MVLFPWSTWAMMQKFRTVSGGNMETSKPPLMKPRLAEQEEGEEGELVLAPLLLVARSFSGEAEAVEEEAAVVECMGCCCCMVPNEQHGRDLGGARPQGCMPCRRSAASRAAAAHALRAMRVAQCCQGKADVEQWSGGAAADLCVSSKLPEAGLSTIWLGSYHSDVCSGLSTSEVRRMEPAERYDPLKVHP